MASRYSCGSGAAATGLYQWPKIIQPNNLHKKILDGINVWIFGNNDNTIVKLTQQQSDDNVLVNELVTFLHAL